jgi:methionyl-tRNA synthetase
MTDMHNAVGDLPLQRLSVLARKLTLSASMNAQDLIGNFGNLVNRATALCEKYCQGKVPDVPPPTTNPLDWYSLRESYCSKMKSFDLQGGAFVTMQGTMTGLALDRGSL